MLLLEKIITVLSVLTVLAVAGLVTLLTFFPKKSGMPDQVINSQLRLNDWLEQKKDPKARANAFVSNRDLDQVFRKMDRKKGRKSPAKVSKKDLAAKTKAKKFDNYIETSGRGIPDEEAVPGIPWVRAQRGVRYIKPKRVPRILYDKVKHFEDAFEAAQAGAGAFEDTGFGPAYRIKWVKPESHLAKVAGLRAGDKILSVNGHKLGNSFSLARQLYDQLKSETKFAVKVLRDGQPTVLTFSVN